MEGKKTLRRRRAGNKFKTAKVLELRAMKTSIRENTPEADVSRKAAEVSAHSLATLPFLSYR